MEALFILHATVSITSLLSWTICFKSIIIDKVCCGLMSYLAIFQLKLMRHNGTFSKILPAAGQLGLICKCITPTRTENCIQNELNLNACTFVNFS